MQPSVGSHYHDVQECLCAARSQQPVAAQQAVDATSQLPEAFMSPNPASYPSCHNINQNNLLYLLLLLFSFSSKMISSPSPSPSSQSTNTVITGSQIKINSSDYPLYILFFCQQLENSLVPDENLPEYNLTLPPDSHLVVQQTSQALLPWTKVFVSLGWKLKLHFWGGLPVQFSGVLSVKDLGLTFLLPTMLTANQSTAAIVVKVLAIIDRVMIILLGLVAWLPKLFQSRPETQIFQKGYKTRLISYAIDI